MLKPTKKIQLRQDLNLSNLHHNQQKYNILASTKSLWKNQAADLYFVKQRLIMNKNYDHMLMYWI